MLGFFLRFLRLHRGLVSTCSRGDREKGTKPKERNGMGKIEEFRGMGKNSNGRFIIRYSG